MYTGGTGTVSMWRLYTGELFPPPHSAEKVAQGIQTYSLAIFDFHTLTSPIQQMKDKHLVRLPIMSDFLKMFYSENTT